MSFQQEIVHKNKSLNKGLISADRNNKATLLLTIPRSLKSYAKDLSSPIFHITIRKLLRTRFRVARTSPNLMHDSKLSIYNQLITERVQISSLSSMDSDLEAFSRNPTHGSFAALAFQLTAKTNYANKRFLSY
jgi:hypothetical protein